VAFGEGEFRVEVSNKKRSDLERLQQRLEAHLKVIYPDADQPALARRLIDELGYPHGCKIPRPNRNIWSEDNVVAITYGDSIERKGEKPLVTLERFLAERLGNVVTGVHILPFFPFSSDDGFAVIDYLKVDERLGDWEDIRRIGMRFNLMADLVLNHCSSRSQWFENFKKRVDPGRDYFIEIGPDDDLTPVIRPRATPLAQTVETADGARQVWCTFSPDQVDLNFANPEVLVEFVRIIRHYLDNEVNMLRLDAVGFLWKQPGTPSMHLPQTHEVVRLLRTLLEPRVPRLILVTETNVPNRENLTYFGNGNEAHAIYNFSLAPLLVHTLISGDCTHLKSWMMSMPPAQFGTAYLNFIASHDGIGLRPAEGLLSDEELESLLATMQSFGGRISMRALGEGVAKPYEINITLWDALKGLAGGPPDERQASRFLCAHAILLTLDGIPAIYIHSFLSTPNDEEAVEAEGHNRAINRHTWDEAELNRELDDPETERGRVFSQLCRLIRIRRKHRAFHPNATQYTLHLGPQIFGLWRQSMNRDQSIFALHNVSAEPQTVSLADLNLIITDPWRDLISGRNFDDRRASLKLEPYQCLWLTNRV